MAENVRTDPPHSMASLVGGIVEDAQQLIRQELMLARREVQQEMDKAKTAAISFGVALGVLALSAILLSLAVVYVVHQVAGLPLWGSYALVGGVFLAVGGTLLVVVKNKVNDINVVPRQTVETMRENVQWIKNQT
jgi:hypothetical protein